MIRKFLCVLILTLIVSCSSDKGEDMDPPQSAIIGTWAMSGVNLEEGNTNSNLTFAKLIVDNLLKEGCSLIKFTFNVDGTLKSEDKVNNLEISAGSSGLEVNCPETIDVFNTTWGLEGDQLTIVNEAGMRETFKIDLNGNTMTIAGKDISPDNYTGADVVFTKE